MFSFETIVSSRKHQIICNYDKTNMKIAVVGGTGECGRGFTLRWAQKHEVIVGSREAKKAEECAEEINKALKGWGIEDPCVSGTDNAGAIMASDLVVLSVPYRFLETVTGDLKECYSDQIVLSPVVPMGRVEKHFEFTPPDLGSASFQVRDLLPPSVRIVAAFHTVSSVIFQDLERVINGDVLVCGDDDEAKKIVSGLISEIKDIRPLNAGPLAVAPMLEALTPMLLNISRRNKLKNAGIKVVEG